MNLSELRWHPGNGLRRVGKDHRNEERDAFLQHVRLVDRQFPLEPKIALGPGLRILGDDRYEQRAGVDFLADLPVPGIPSLKLGLIEPHLDP